MCGIHFECVYHISAPHRGKVRPVQPFYHPPFLWLWLWLKRGRLVALNLKFGARKREREEHMKRLLRDELSGRDVRSLRDGGGNGSARFPAPIGGARLHPSKSSDLIIVAEGLSSTREASLR